MGRKRVDRRDSLEDWLLEEQRRHLERLLAPTRTTASRAGTAAGPADGLSARPVAAAARAGWLLAFGVCAASFGAALVIWGWWAERAELWRLGLPAAVIGQSLLWMGFRLRPRGGAIPPALADPLARADGRQRPAVWPDPLPVFPPLPSLRAMRGKHARQV